MNVSVPFNLNSPVDLFVVERDRRARRCFLLSTLFRRARRSRPTPTSNNGKVPAQGCTLSP